MMVTPEKRDRTLYLLQMLTAFLQFIGKQYPATEQDRSSFLKLMT